MGFILKIKKYGVFAIFFLKRNIFKITNRKC